MNIREIAGLAHVSPSTISIVLNNRPGVSDETRQKVQAILKQQGYALPSHRRAAAGGLASPETAMQRSLRFLKYKQHGMLVDRNEGFIASIIDAIESEARKRGFNLVMTSADSQNWPEVLNMVRNNPLEGIIILGTEMEPQELSGLAGMDMPIVIIDNYLPYMPFDSIVMNNAEITHQAVGYLHQLGFQKIGYLQSSVPINNFRQRATGFYDAIRAFGMICEPEHVIKLTPTIDGARQDMENWLTAGIKLPPAVFADNDTIAIGAMRALKEQDIRIPQDISIIGFDDISAARVVDPPLTTMRVYQEEIGRWAVRRLNDKINDKNKTAAKTVMKIQLGGAVVKRGSTAPAGLISQT